MNHFFHSVQSMGNNLVVKVRCGLFSGNHYPQTIGVHIEAESEGNQKQNLSEEQELLTRFIKV